MGREGYGGPRDVTSLSLTEYSLHDRGGHYDYADRGVCRERSRRRRVGPVAARGPGAVGERLRPRPEAER